MKSIAIIPFILLPLIWCNAQTSYTVTSINDVGAGTLRSIIADSVSTGDTIFFDPAINADTIFLTSGQINIDKALVIKGNGIASTFIDGSKDIGSNSRLFDIVGVGSSLHLLGTNISNFGEFDVLFGGAIISNTELHLEDCIFNSNKGDSGGAVHNSSGNLTITRCIFKNNTVDFRGGAVEVNGLAIISNSLFVDNSSDTDGGGVFILPSGTSRFYNCTFSKNAAGSLGGGIGNIGSVDSLVNCILYDNSGTNPDYSGTNVSHGFNNLFEDIAGSGLTAGMDGNIVDDPEFVSAEDFRLQVNSPAIDSGMATTRSEPVDLLGNKRTIHAKKDIGAYEFICPLTPSQIYVDIDATGDDLGLVWTDAFTDLQDAIDLACTCDTLVTEIWVKEGVYFPTALLDADRNGVFEERESTFLIPKNVKIYGGFAGVETSKEERNLIIYQTILSGDLGITGDSTDNAYHIMFIDGASGISIDSNTIIDGFHIQFGNADGPKFISSEGAGLYLDGKNGNQCSPIIRNCEFSFNTATSGGAILCAGFQGESSPQIESCFFFQNRATDGGAILNSGQDFGTSSPQIENCSFVQNTALNNGGAIVNNGSEGGDSSPQLVNCSFFKNAAGKRGGAMHSIGLIGGRNDPDYLNCTFFKNQAGERGGAIYHDNQGSSLISNCILWNNEAPNRPEIDVLNESSSVDVGNSILDDGLEDENIILPLNVSDRGNNLDLDPMFMDTLIGDLRLRTGSPAINQGDNTVIPTDVDSDLQGSFRVVDNFVDIGAYELSGTECESAIRLSCGDTLQATARHQGAQPAEELPDCLFSTSNYYRSTWFTFIGTGDSIKLSLSDYETSSNLVEMHLLRGECGAFDCEAGLFLVEPNSGDIFFTTKKDSLYQLYVAVWSAGPDDLDDFSLSMTCLCDDRNLSYSSPQDFIRGDMQKIETDATIQADNIIGREADIIYDADQGIDLKMGFEVEAGATFLALPDGCGGSE